MNADNNDLIPMGAPASEFTIVMRGYERNQVNDAISRLEDDLRTIMSEREQALQQASDAHSRAERLAAELDELKNELRHTQAPTFETMGGRIASMLRLAEEEASDIRVEAEKDAEATRSAAQQERELAEQQLASDRAEADQYVADRRSEADDVLAKAKAEATEHLDKNRKLAEETLSTAQSEAARLTAESEAHRTEAEEDFNITLASRRKESEREESERDARSRADAAARIQASKDEAAARIQASRDESDAMLTQAHTDATATVDSANARSLQIITDAENEVNRLQNLRSALAQQIMQVGQLVSNVPAYLAKPPEDLPVDRDVDAPAASAPTAPALFSGERTDDLGATKAGTPGIDAEPTSSESGPVENAATDPDADKSTDGTVDASTAGASDGTGASDGARTSERAGTSDSAGASDGAEASDGTGAADGTRASVNPGIADAGGADAQPDGAAQAPTAAGDETVAAEADDQATEDEDATNGDATAPSADAASDTSRPTEDTAADDKSGRNPGSTPGIVLTRRRGTVATEQRPVQVSAIRQRRKR